MSPKPLDRRETLGVLLGAGAALATGCTKPSGATGAATMSSTRMPAIFLAHGAPPLLDDARWMSELHAWAKSMPRPKAILMLSAHWEERPVTLGATTPVPLFYDFYGFPERYYQTKYPSPGAPELAKRIHEIVGRSQPVVDEPGRGLDHGAYVPLVAMYPEADVPVLQASLPTMDAKELYAFGKQLAPLRDEGVLIVGSGFITHNLRAMDWGPSPRTPQWASDFDSWTADTLARADVDALLDYRVKAPGVQMALPTHEHFVPLVVAMGAAGDDATRLTTPISGFWMGSATRRSVQLG